MKSQAIKYTGKKECLDDKWRRENDLVTFYSQQGHSYEIRFKND